MEARAPRGRAVGCGGARNSPERLGDEAWHRGQWAVAMAQYRLVGDAPRVLAKLADAALLAGDLTGAATLYRQLGKALTRPAPVSGPPGWWARCRGRAAGRQRPRGGGLHRGARRGGAGVADGRLALRLPADVHWSPRRSWRRSGRRGSRPAGAGNGGCWPSGAARTRRPSAVPRPLRSWNRRSAVGIAARPLTPPPPSWRRVSSPSAWPALGSGRPGEADFWLGQAATADPLGASGRRALVALGDAKLAQGTPSVHLSGSRS